jgi:hypothetical protein
MALIKIQRRANKMTATIHRRAGFLVCHLICVCCCVGGCSKRPPIDYNVRVADRTSPFVITIPTVGPFPAQGDGIPIETWVPPIFDIKTKIKPGQAFVIEGRFEINSGDRAPQTVSVVLSNEETSPAKNEITSDVDATQFDPNMPNESRFRTSLVAPRTKGVYFLHMRTLIPSRALFSAKISVDAE